MKFKNYLNEANEEIIYKVDDFNQMLHNQCKPYLKMIKNFDTPLLRGIRKLNMNMGLKQVRKNRKPLGMENEIAKILNDWLEKNGHNRRDQSFMVSSLDRHIEKFFGSSYYIFPIGDFSYSWIESKDINISDSRTGWDRFAVEDYNYETGTGIEMSKPFADYFHTDKLIDKAVKNGYEIWINCKQYFFVRSKFFKWDKNKQIVIEN